MNTKHMNELYERYTTDELEKARVALATLNEFGSHIVGDTESDGFYDAVVEHLVMVEAVLVRRYVWR